MNGESLVVPAKAESRPGRLIYVVGPSGAGKDSLIDYARGRLAPDLPVAFAQRHITRPNDAGGEKHVALDEAGFEAQRRAGRFALSWDGNGLRYGIGVEMDQALARGLDVVVNGSRGHLASALARYPGMLVVWVSAPESALVSRMRKRGRESEGEIALRISRLSGLRPPPGISVVEIVNAADLETAGERLVAILASGGDENFAGRQED